jgi:hypothetical protein
MVDAIDRPAILCGCSAGDDAIMLLGAGSQKISRIGINDAHYLDITDRIARAGSGAASSGIEVKGDGQVDMTAAWRA